MSLSTSTRIAELNDRFRKTGPMFRSHNRWIWTAGISAEGIAFVFAAIHAVRTFDAFTEDNDPHGEHDFGTVEVNGIKLFWKIDCYDSTMEYGSPDPTDPKVTCRVMTIMLPSEY